MGTQSCLGSSLESSLGVCLEREADGDMSISNVHFSLCVVFSHFTSIVRSRLLIVELQPPPYHAEVRVGLPHDYQVCRSMVCALAECK